MADLRRGWRKLSLFLNRPHRGYYQYYYSVHHSHTSHWAGARGVLGVEKIVFLLWSLPCQLETAIFLKKGIESTWVCPEWWQNATWKWSQNRLQKHSKHFHSFWPMPRKDSPSSRPHPHPHPHPPHLKKIHTPISNLAIYLAHNHRKRAELLTSLVAYPDPESTLKRMYSTGFPSLPAHCRRQIQ